MTTIKERNSNNEVELRRNRDRLISIGSGIMAFAVWSVIKMTGLYLYNRQALFDYVGSEVEATSPAEKALITNLSVALVAFVMFIAVLIQMYTGASAIVVGRGKSKKKRRMYLVYGVFMLMFSALSIIQLLKSSFTGQTNDVPDILKGSIIVELTWFILIIEMFYSSIKIRQLESAGKHSKAK